jgi:hypothetical protein
LIPGLEVADTFKDSGWVWRRNDVGAAVGDAAVLAGWCRPRRAGIGSLGDAEVVCDATLGPFVAAGFLWTLLEMVEGV